MTMFESIRDLSEAVTLIKGNGQRLEIFAEIQSKTAYIPDIDTPVEIDDIIERPRGTVIDRFIVTEVLPWNSKLDGDSMFEPHIQVKIKPYRNSCHNDDTAINISGSIKAGNVIINSGNSARISLSDNNKFEDLIKSLKESSADVEIIRSAEDMRDCVGETSFKAKYEAFISSLANHVTILQAVIPYLPWLNGLQ